MDAFVIFMLAGWLAACWLSELGSKSNPLLIRGQKKKKKIPCLYDTLLSQLVLLRAHRPTSKLSIYYLDIYLYHLSFTAFYLSLSLINNATNQLHITHDQRNKNPHLAVPGRRNPARPPRKRRPLLPDIRSHNPTERCTTCDAILRHAANHREHGGRVPGSYASLAGEACRMEFGH